MGLGVLEETVSVLHTEQAPEESNELEALVLRLLGSKDGFSEESASLVREEPPVVESDEPSVDSDAPAVSRSIPLEPVSYQLDPAAAEAFYRQTVDYDELYAHMGAGSSIQSSASSIVYSETIVESEHSAVMHTKQAEVMVARIQQLQILKSDLGVSVKDKEAFAYWQAFNKALLMLYHATSAIRSSEVNYGSINVMDSNLAF